MELRLAIFVLFLISAQEKCIRNYTPQNGQVAKFVDLPTPINDFDSMPQAKGAPDGFALAQSDGAITILLKTGKFDKKNTQKAHKYSAIAVKWSYDGSSLASSGEDGVIKIWSRNGSFRNQLFKGQNAIYSLGWSPQNDAVIFCSQKTITIKPIQPSRKALTWKAHDALVLKVDWNPSNNLIVSTGQDCRYKIWDNYGRQLFCSNPYDYVLTAAAWAPCGEYFVVGGYGMIRLCDKTGWTYSYNKMGIGSPFKLIWSTDSTQVAVGCGNGDVAIGTVLYRSFFYDSWEAQVVEQQKILVKDLLNQAQEQIQFKDRIVNVSINYGHLIITTSRQCYVYNFNNWNTPNILQLKDAVTMVIQSAKNFILLDISNGLIIYNYDGKNLCTVKLAGKYQFLTKKRVSLSLDTLAIIQNNNRSIKFYDLMSGKVQPFQIDHITDIVEVHLNQVQNAAQRKIAFCDSNKDLHLCPYNKKDSQKIAGICQSFYWNTKADILAATSDQRFLIWYSPAAVFIDKDILQLCKSSKQAPQIGHMSQILSFTNFAVTIRKKDGSIISQNVSPYPFILYQFCDKLKWQKAIKLCRYVKQQNLWACMASASLLGRQLNSAQIALAAIQMADKVQYINYVKELPSQVSRQAALALFFKRYQQAQQILVQAKLFYRAVKMNIKLFRWENALNLAYGFKKHVDTVVAYRNRYLQRIGKQQNLKKFLKAKQDVGDINWQKIKSEIRSQKDRQKKMK